MYRCEDNILNKVQDLDFEFTPTSPVTCNAPATPSYDAIDSEAYFT